MDYLEEIRKKGRKANPFFILMGIDVDSIGNGNAQLSMSIRPDMLNGLGWLQGGLYTALSDEAMALALFTVIEKGKRIATISESTSYLQGIKEGKIAASGKVIKEGRNVSFVEGHVWKYDSKELLSQTNASFAVFYAFQ